MSGSSKELSVIVPTYDEYENIRELCTRLFKAIEKAGLKAELLVVDDESKGTEQTVDIVNELKKSYPIRIHCRRKAEGRGLSSAVLLGFSKARYNTLLCMDADLQHEPESVPAVAKPVLERKAEFSVGSRNVPGGGVAAWALHRKIISAGATLLAWPLSGSTDPMSGFFCTTKEVLARGDNRINPIGFKVYTRACATNDFERLLSLLSHFCVCGILLDRIRNHDAMPMQLGSGRAHNVPG